MASTLLGPIPDCSQDAELLREIFHGKWRLRVLRELLDGPVRLSQLRRAIPGCSKKMIVETLHGLEKLAWIERRDFVTRLKRVEYRLAPVCADELTRIIRKLI